ncbi:MAG: Gfo/Idh/MocA family oxidoreductase, partial [Rhodothermales bacterium]|nr:Gfo/Idh/MocA family oxidoreductase [Rhodothermales bacterium]
MPDPDSRPIRLAQVGVGYWGKNLLRNFAALPGAVMTRVCDQDAAVRARIEAAHPGVETTARYADLLEDGSVEAIVVATETPLHFEMKRQRVVGLGGGGGGGPPPLGWGGGGGGGGGGTPPLSRLGERR